MKNEARENISVERFDSVGRYDPFILLRTEQTAVQDETFPSIEKVRGSKRFKKWSGRVCGMGLSISVGIVGAEGIARMLSGFESRNFSDALVGAQMAILGGGSIYYMARKAFKAGELAGRQIEELQSYRRS